MGVLINLEPLRAGMGGYFPLLLVIFIWWVFSRGVGKNGSDPEGQGANRSPRQRVPPQSSNSAEGITPLNVLRQMFFGGLEMPPPQSQPPAAFVVPDFGDDRPDDSQEMPDWQAGLSSPQAVAEMIVQAAPLREEELGPPIPIVRPQSEPRVKRRALVQARTTTRRELQRAIIWSEIIALPLSLRE